MNRAIILKLVPRFTVFQIMTPTFRIIVSGTFGFLLLVILSVNVNAASISLFNGKTFDGWEGDTVKTWRIENGVIKAGSLETKAHRNEFLFTTQTFENFELRLSFKITGNININAGVQFRTKRIPDHHEVIGFQADIGKRVDGHLYDESRRRRMLASPEKTVLDKAQAAVGADGWQTYRIRAVGDRIQLWLNGVKTVDYVEKEANIPRTGIIAIQIHGGMQGIIAYKDIQIEELDASGKTKNPN